MILQYILPKKDLISDILYVSSHVAYSHNYLDDLYYSMLTHIQPLCMYIINAKYEFKWQYAKLIQIWPLSM